MLTATPTAATSGPLTVSAPPAHGRHARIPDVMPTTAPAAGGTAATANPRAAARRAAGRAARACAAMTRLAGAAAVAAVLLLGAQAASAQPLSLTVNDRSDAADASPGDGACATAAGTCALRAAVQEANAHSGHDTISFPALSVFHPRDVVTLALAGTGEDAAQTGDLDVTDGLTIAGNGARRTILDGARLDRVFDIDPAGLGITVDISGVTIRNGMAPDSGGGLRSSGRLTLANSAVSANRSAINGGGIAVEANSAIAEFTHVSITGNDAGRTGGGVMNRATMTLTGVTIGANTASAEGGGLWNSGLAALKAVTVSANTAKGLAGGQFAGGIGNGGSASLENVTISANTGDPGGIHNGGPAKLINVAVVNNTGGILNCAGCGGTLTAVNTIVADSPFIPGINCYGPITSQGHNLDSGSSCGFTAAGDIVNVNPLLGPLASSVGRTRTHALLAGSPAIGAGDNTRCPPADQRGVGRPQGSGCDIGPHELQSGALAVNSRVDAVDASPGDGVCETAVPGQCTLRAAVIEANARPGPGLIRFAVNGRFLLTRPGSAEDAGATGDLDITDDVTIAGNGPLNTVVGGQGRRLRDRVLDIHNGSGPGVVASISGLTTERGNLGNGGEGAGVLAGDLADRGDTRLVMRDTVVRSNTLGFLSEGGGIASEGALELSDSEVSANTASLGAGIFAGTGADAVTSDVSVTGNAATSDGGGVFLAPDATAELRDTTVTKNTAGSNGGGLVNHGTAAFMDGTLSGNSLNDPASSGGGIWNDGTLSVSRAMLTANTAKRWGGALFNDISASASIAASTLSANNAAAGGGAYNNIGAKLTIAASTFSANDAAGFGGGAVSNNAGTVNLTNATLSANTAAGAGGAIRNISGGSVSLLNATISANSAATGAGIQNESGTVTLHNTILSANTAGNCAGLITSAGHNLDSQTTCGLTATGDLANTNALLGPLAANGGPTETHALPAASPAIDAADACPATDQRGVTRPQGPGCDAGAYERLTEVTPRRPARAPSGGAK